MTLPTYGAWKLASWIINLAALAILVMEPTVKIALIMSVPSTGTLLLGIVIFITGRRDERKRREDAEESKANQAALKESMDGHFTELIAKSERQGNELVVKTDQLSFEKGQRVGMEKAAENTKDELKAATDARVAEGVNVKGDVKMAVAGNVQVDKSTAKDIPSEKEKS